MINLNIRLLIILKICIPLLALIAKHVTLNLNHESYNFHIKIQITTFKMKNLNSNSESILTSVFNTVKFIKNIRKWKYVNCLTSNIQNTNKPSITIGY